MKIKLLKDHTHSGKQYVAGDVIETDDATYEWLANHRVATCQLDDEPKKDPLSSKKSFEFNTLRKVPEKQTIETVNNLDPVPIKNKDLTLSKARLESGT